MQQSLVHTSTVPSPGSEPTGPSVAPQRAIRPIGAVTFALRRTHLGDDPVVTVPPPPPASWITRWFGLGPTLGAAMARTSSTVGR